MPPPRRTAADLAERLLAGDKRALARAITLIENDDPQGWELVREVFPKTGRARIVGEKTPGAVLSSKLFDIPGGFHLRVPFADYYSTKNGRIEGAGVTPDIFVAADEALDVALRL